MNMKILEAVNVPRDKQLNIIFLSHPSNRASIFTFFPTFCPSNHRLASASVDAFEKCVNSLSLSFTLTLIPCVHLTRKCTQSSSFLTELFLKTCHVSHVTFTCFACFAFFPFHFLPLLARLILSWSSLSSIHVNRQKPLPEILLTLIIGTDTCVDFTPLFTPAYSL